MDVVELGDQVKVFVPLGVPEVDPLAVGEDEGLVAGAGLPPLDQVGLGVGVEAVYLVLGIMLVSHNYTSNIQASNFT